MVIDLVIDTCSWEASSPFIDRETVKGGLNQSVDGINLIMKKCGVCCCDSNDANFYKTLKGILRCTVRELAKRVRVKHVKTDREPSRVPLKMLIPKLKKRVSRQKLKKIILKSTPVSSKMHHLLQNYSLCYKNYVHRTDCFFTKYFRFRPQSIYACSNAGNDFDQDQYNVSKKKLLTSGDVELNPGPLTYKKTNLCSASPLSILEARLHQFGLKHRDVGGAGDCFFRAVSHQLFLLNPARQILLCSRLLSGTCICHF